MKIKLTFITIHHFLFFYGFYLLGLWYIPFVLLSGFIFVRIINEEILHKGIAHNMYKSHKILDWVWALAAVLLGQGSSIGWATIHRQHHAFTDTDRDPQSPYHQPVWKVYAGLFYTQKRNPTMIENLTRSTAHVFTKKYYYILHFSICMILFLINPLILIMLISPGVVYGFHALGWTNAFSHLYGEKIDGSEGRNLWWVSMLCFTREQHADHHHSPISTKHILFKKMLR